MPANGFYHTKLSKRFNKSDLDVSKMIAKQLRKELENRGLDAKGLKKVLQERLQDALDDALLEDDDGDQVSGKKKNV